MESFPIRIEFRGRRIPAQVHQHDEYFLVWFTDTEILHDFGGQIRVSADLKTITGHKPQKDDKDFHNAIVSQLYS